MPGLFSPVKGNTVAFLARRKDIKNKLDKNKKREALAPLRQYNAVVIKVTQISHKPCEGGLKGVKRGSPSTRQCYC